MKLNLPDKLDILDQEVEILYKKNLKHKGISSDGVANNIKLRIEIDTTIPHQRQLGAIFHEILEYIFEELGTTIQRENEEHSYLMSHKEVDIASRMLLQAIQSWENL